MQEIQSPISGPQLISFLQPFAYKLITISIQPEPPNKVVPTGKFFSNKNRVLAFVPSKFPEMLPDLYLAQSKGCAIYFMVNEGDGRPEEGSDNLNCGKRVNVKILKSLFIDTDDADASLLWHKLTELRLFPHHTLESSPNKYHVYFHIEPEEITTDNLTYWEGIQSYLGTLVPGLDPKMNNCNRVLRLPEFFHLKDLNNPFKVKIIKTHDFTELPRYNLKRLYDQLEIYKHIVPDKLISSNGDLTNGAKPYTPFVFPTYPVPKGSRRNTLHRYYSSLMENYLDIDAPDQAYLEAGDKDITDIYFLPEHREDYKEGGKIRHNLTRSIIDCRRKRKEKNKAEARKMAYNLITEPMSVDVNSLPDSFYLNFPGDLGEFTQEIHNCAPYVPLELCFAGALMVSGALKSETYRFKGYWPFLNGIVIAPPGAGKSTLKTIVNDILKAAGLKGMFPKLLASYNSVQALHADMYGAGGTATVIIDESGDYLKNITAKNAPAYATALKSYFKNGTTAKGLGTELSPGRSMSYSLPTIEYGMLSLWMLIQPSMFLSTINMADIEDGFLTRFFIFKGKLDPTFPGLTSEDTEDDKVKSFELSPNMLATVEGLNAAACKINEVALLEKTEKDIKDSGAKIKPNDLYSAKREAIYVARSEARTMGLKSVFIYPDAKYVLDEYCKEQRAFASQLDDPDTNPKTSIYQRIKEMIYRLCCNAATFDSDKDGLTLTKEVVVHCIHFHRFQLNRFFQKELTELSKDKIDKSEEAVLQALVKICNREKRAVTYGELNMSLKSTKRPYNLQVILDNLVKCGEVWKSRRDHRRTKEAKVDIYKPADSEEAEKEPTQKNASSVHAKVDSMDQIDSMDLSV